MDASIAAEELVRPWRRATIVASLLAAVELVLLLGAGALLLARPLSHLLQRQAAAAAESRPVTHHAPRAVVPMPKPKPVAKPKLARSELAILVLNGNGQNGAAGMAAGRLRHLGYRIAATGNAKRQDYATTVFRRPRFEAASSPLSSAPSTQQRGTPALTSFRAMSFSLTAGSCESSS